LWAFEINALVRFIEVHLAMLPPGATITQFGLRGAPVVQTHAAFVERLTHLWETRAEREQDRLPAGHMLDAVIGLHDLHYVLAGNLDFDSFLRKNRGVTISLQENEYVAAWAGPGSAQTYVKHPPAKVLDQSLRGYRLLWEKLGGMRVRVGELACHDEFAVQVKVGPLTEYRAGEGAIAFGGGGKSIDVLNLAVGEYGTAGQGQTSEKNDGNDPGPYTIH